MKEINFKALNPNYMGMENYVQVLYWFFKVFICGFSIFLLILFILVWQLCELTSGGLCMFLVLEHPVSKFQNCKRYCTGDIKSMNVKFI